MVLGDAFIGRVKETDEEFERMDFLRSEVSSSAQWLLHAERHNKGKLSQPTAQEILKKMKPSPIVEITPAEDARQRGHSHTFYE